MPVGEGVGCRFGASVLRGSENRAGMLKMKWLGSQRGGIAGRQYVVVQGSGISKGKASP